MKTLYDRAIGRLLSLLGVDLDFSIDLHGARFSRITDTLYLGARPSAEHTGALKDIGITHVVSALREEERTKMAFLSADFESLFLDLHDGVHQDMGSIFPVFFRFVDDALSSRSGAMLLVHCEAGVSRSAALAIALLMKTQRRTFFEAFCEVRAKRAQVLPNIGFASQLQRLELELHPEGGAESGIDSLAQFLHQICNVPVEFELLQSTLRRHDYDALQALHAIFGPELPRMVQGVRF